MLVVVPNVALETSPLGGEKFVLLSALKNSVRNSSFLFSIAWNSYPAFRVAAQDLGVVQLRIDHQGVLPLRAGVIAAVGLIAGDVLRV